jgi:hypothetical protein
MKMLFKLKGYKHFVILTNQPKVQRPVMTL